MSNQKKNREMEDFWDIERLLPPKTKSSHKSSIPHTPKTDPVTIHINTASVLPREDSEKNKLTMPQKPPIFQEHSIFATYYDFSPLTPKVEIRNWKSIYNYYDFFCRQAASLYSVHGKQCDEVHFFSYVAQYSQLNRRQLDWYLWWRENVRNGNYLKVDVSYIHLLIFEIINLGNTVDTKKSLDILVALWRNYKDVYPQLRDPLGNWICDYSLIYNVPLQFPLEEVDPDVFSMILFKKAFFSFDLSDASVMSRVFLTFCSNYNYKKSKFYHENKEAYDIHIPRAMASFFSRVDMSKLLASEPIKHASIAAFVGALCSYKMRKHIEVDYIALFDSQELKIKIGETIRYTENKLRAYLGIRSRLGVTLNNEKIKTCIDSYFSRELSVRSEQPLPEYERLYETKDTSFSLRSALDIEKQSWEVTEKLVDAFEEELVEDPLPSTTEPVPSSSEKSEKECFLSVISHHQDLFNAILVGDFTAQRHYMEQAHLFPEAVIDEINEAAAEFFGDILIEESDEGYQIIEDYRSIFEQGDL